MTYDVMWYPFLSQVTINGAAVVCRGLAVPLIRIRQGNIPLPGLCKWDSICRGLAGQKKSPAFAGLCLPGSHLEVQDVLRILF
jgi:hypothetical protein